MLSLSAYRLSRSLAAGLVDGCNSVGQGLEMSQKVADSPTDREGASPRRASINGASPASLKLARAVWCRPGSISTVVNLPSVLANAQAIQMPE